MSASNTDDELDIYDRDSAFDEEAELEGPLPEAVEYDPHAVVGNLQWDEDLTPGPSAVDSPSARHAILIPQRPTRRDTFVPRSLLSSSTPHEDTPLLHKPTALTFAEPPRPSTGNDVLPPIAMPVDGPPETLTRRLSQASLRSRRGSTTSRMSKAVQTGQSTSGQTVSLLYAFNIHCYTHSPGRTDVQCHCNLAWDWYAFGAIGLCICWLDRRHVSGDILRVYYMLYVSPIKCIEDRKTYSFSRSAKILAHIILDDSKLRSYSDIGRKAFGSRSSPFISALFCLELFTVRYVLS